MELLLIGQGAWASKIQSVLNHPTNNVNATAISARVALNDPSKIIEIAKSFEVIWICTKPEWQLELLPKLSSFDGKLILEKPYIVDELSFKRLSEFRGTFKGALQLSEPWTHSNIWAVAKKEINKSKDIKFEIQRGGPTGHEFMPVAMDWLPHDINLLFDLYGIELLNSKVTNIHWKKRTELNFEITVVTGAKFILKVGNFEGNRVAHWESNDLAINFLDSTLTSGFSKKAIIQGVNPFILQVNAKVQNLCDKTEKQLAVQNYFFQKLFT
jgi:hypothetical protein